MKGKQTPISFFFFIHVSVLLKIYQIKDKENFKKSTINCLLKGCSQNKFLKELFVSR